jgi:hypothetical protein
VSLPLAIERTLNVKSVDSATRNYLEPYRNLAAKDASKRLGHCVSNHHA